MRAGRVSVPVSGIISPPPIFFSFPTRSCMAGCPCLTPFSSPSPPSSSDSSRERATAVSLSAFFIPPRSSGDTVTFPSRLRAHFPPPSASPSVSLFLAQRCSPLLAHDPPDPFPPAPTRRSKLESNFPHHIPQKLLRGGAGSNARRTAFPPSLPPSGRRNGETFLSFLCLPRVSPAPSPRPYARSE